DPFPNSEVKRCCGDDSLGVALRENSSMPGLIFNNNASSILLEGGFVFGGDFLAFPTEAPRSLYRSVG
ncbi:MAG: hypothetical protein ACK4YK_15120, partial [Dolichospermum sp.]